MTAQTLNLLSDLLCHTKRAGADAADVLFLSGTSLNVGVRNGVVETLERSEAHGLELRVFVGKKNATVFTTTIDPNQFTDFVERAVAMAHILPDDQYAGLASQALTGVFDTNSLELEDPVEPTTKDLLERAHNGEQAALAVTGVTNSAGSNASWHKIQIALATSAGFTGTYYRTCHANSVCVLAGTGQDMQRDYDYHQTVWLEDLTEASILGRNAGQQAVARLNPTRPRTGRYPVVFHPRVASSFLDHFAHAINGATIARGTSFLKNSLGKKIFAQSVHIIDDPHRMRGLYSCPFDGEALQTAPIHFVQDGILNTWVLDSRSARQLGLQSNARAARRLHGPPTPATTNLFFEAGKFSPQELMDDITEGIYVTEMMGSAVNLLTGDYSRGATGFMIRHGKIAEPITEFTLAGHLLEIFSSLRLAHDLSFRFGTDSPTLRVDALNIAGS